MQNTFKTCLFIIALSAIVFTQSALAQNTFQRTYNFTNTSFLKEILVLPNNNYLVCGTLIGNGFYVMKIDSTGQPVWANAINTTKENYPITFEPCSDGGIIMCGYIKDAFNNWDIFLTRTDSLGNVLWSHAYGGNQGDFGNFAKQTNDGGFITGGTLQLSGTQVRHCLIKTDANGTVQWAQSYADTANFSSSTANDVYELSNGYIICGRILNASGLPSDYDATLIRTDLSGSIQWAKSFGMAEWDQFNKVIATNDGGFIAGGWVDTIAGGNIREVLLTKFDATGNVVWAKTYGGIGDDIGWDFCLTAAKGVVITGRTTSFGLGSPDYYMLVTDSIGNVTWTNSYGGTGEENLYSGLQTPDGGFMAGGSTVSFGSFSDNSYLIKTNANGYSSCNELLSPNTLTGNITLPLVNSLFIQSAGVDTNYAIISTNSTTIPSVNLLCSSTSIAEISNDDVFTVLPNPANDFITVLFSKFAEEEMTLNLYNSVGEIISSKTKNTNDAQITFNLMHCASGVYFLNVSGKNNVRKTVKVIRL